MTEKKSTTAKKSSSGAKKPGLYANIHAKQERIKHGSGEKMNKPGAKSSPSKTDFDKSEKTSQSALSAKRSAAAKKGAATRRKNAAAKSS